MSVIPLKFDAARNLPRRLQVGDSLDPTVMPSVLLINHQTAGDYTAIADDAGHEIWMDNAAANILTVDPSLYPANTQIMVKQAGAGATTVAVANPGTNSLHTLGSITAKLAGQYAFAIVTIDSATAITVGGQLEVGAAGAGTVTSVALALPTLFSVTGSPVTGSGTLTGAFATQAKNTVLAGPVTGANAAPGMRALVAADIPVVANVPINAKTSTAGAVTLAAGDAGCVAELDSSTTSCVIDPTLYQNGDVGLIRALGTSVVTISGANASVITRFAETAKIAGQFATVWWQIKSNAAAASGNTYINGELAAS